MVSLVGDSSLVLGHHLSTCDVNSGFTRFLKHDNLNYRGNV